MKPDFRTEFILHLCTMFEENSHCLIYVLIVLANNILSTDKNIKKKCREKSEERGGEMSNLLSSEVYRKQTIDS